MKGLCKNCIGEGCKYCCGSGQDISLDDDDDYDAAAHESVYPRY